MICTRGKKRSCGLFRRSWARRAAAAVEMAVVSPLLFAMLFGIIEYGWVMTVRQTLTAAAREGARTAAMPGSTDDAIRARVNEVLEPMHLNGVAKIYLTRSTVDSPTENVRVDVAYTEVTLVGNFFGRTDFKLVGSCSMRKEGLD